MSYSKTDYNLLQDEVCIEDFDISPLHSARDHVVADDDDEEVKPKVKAKTTLDVYLRACCTFITHVFPTTGSAFVSLSRSFNNDLDLWRIIVDVQHFDIGRTRLSVAAFEGRVQRIMRLLVLGSNVNLPRKDSFTCLIMSSQNGHLEAVKELVKAGADMNAKSNSGVTSLMIRCVCVCVCVCLCVCVFVCMCNMSNKHTHTHNKTPNTLTHVLITHTYTHNTHTQCSKRPSRRGNFSSRARCNRGPRLG